MSLFKLSDSHHIVDVRKLDSAYRQPRVFAAFDALAPGEHFILVHDAAPRPLHEQLMRERPAQFEWEYLQAGPGVWCVFVGKREG